MSTIVPLAARCDALLRRFPAGSLLQARPGLGAVAAFRALDRQDLRTVPIPDAGLILVVEGRKELALDGRGALIPAGGAVALRAGADPDIGNIPDPARGRYQALALTFAAETLSAFARHYPGLAARADTGAPWHVIAESADLAEAMIHAADGLLPRTGLSETAARHRLLEVLLVLAEAGAAWPAPEAVGDAARLRMLLAAKPARPWTAADAAAALGVAGATLRRRLAAEGWCFRDLLAEVRLAHGLLLLQTTRLGVTEIALSCGYESPSRFARRFRDRFGVTPSHLRACGPGEDQDWEQNGTKIEQSGRAAPAAPL